MTGHSTGPKAEDGHPEPLCPGLGCAQRRRLDRKMGKR